MKMERKTMIKASATMIGFIIGVGMFGVPYAIAKSGFIIGLFYLVGLGLIMMVLHHFYTDIALNTKEKHRYIGYARIYLGKWGRRIAYFTTLFGITGSLIAYIIVGGEFMNALVGQYFGGNVFDYQIIFFALISFAVLVGLTLISSIEIGMTVFLLAVMGIIFIYGIPRVELTNLITVNHRDIFVPYGVILFAIAGLNAIPEIRDILRGYPKDMRRVVTLGSILPLSLIAIFSFVVVGVTGFATSEEAILGLANAWGGWMVYIGALFGFLAITTSALVTLTNLKECLMYDLKYDKYLAWFIVTMVPLLIFLAGAQDFIGVISFTGAIFGGANGILLAMMFMKLRKKKKPRQKVLRWPAFVPYVVIAVFVLGIIYEVFYRLLG